MDIIPIDHGGSTRIMGSIPMGYVPMDHEGSVFARGVCVPMDRGWSFLGNDG